MPVTDRARAVSGCRSFNVALNAFLLVVMTIAGAITLTYLTVPDHNTAASRFDTLIVLGCSADPDDSPSPEQRERVMEAVREFRAGHAGTIIVSGGSTIGKRIEADTMARGALEAGVSPDRLFEERQSLDTVRNIFYSRRIMEERGWITVEVISSPESPASCSADPQTVEQHLARSRLALVGELQIWPYRAVLPA